MARKFGATWYTLPLLPLLLLTHLLFPPPSLPIIAAGRNLPGWPDYKTLMKLPLHYVTNCLVADSPLKKPDSRRQVVNYELSF